MEKVTRFGVSIPIDLAKTFDSAIHKKGYKNRSEAIRDIIRDYLVEIQWQNPENIVMGTVTIVYDHHTRELTSVLSEMQHKYYESIICNTHVHFNEHDCLEVIIVKGKGAMVQEIADRLISIKGVKHGKLVCTTTGKTIK